MHIHEDVNQATISGTLRNIGQLIYIPFPVISFDIHALRPVKVTGRSGGEAKSDVIRVVVTGDERFAEKYREGDRLLIRGMFLSRNFEADRHQVAREITQAVRNYMDVFEAFPSRQNPSYWKKSLIDWDVLIRSGFLANAPADSLYDAAGEKVKPGPDAPAQTKYIYRVDKNGLVYKETQHTSYEVQADSCEKLGQAVDARAGDINRIVLRGDVRRAELSRPNDISMLSFRVHTRTALEANHNCVIWGVRAEELHRQIALGCRAHVEGRLQDRRFFRKFRNAENELVDKPWTTVNVSCSSVRIVAPGKEERS